VLVYNSQDVVGAPSTGISHLVWHCILLFVGSNAFEIDKRVATEMEAHRAYEVSVVGSPLGSPFLSQGYTKPDPVSLKLRCAPHHVLAVLSFFYARKHPSVSSFP
jgi:hypothetical protein